MNMSKSHVDSILISKMYQSREMFDKAKEILNKNYKSPESDFRNLAIDLSEFLSLQSINNYSLENKLENLKI